MKLLQLNIWMGKLSREVIKLIEAEKPDILCLQEVFSSGETLIHIPDAFFSCLEFITPVTGHENVFFAPTFSLEYGGNTVDFGNAIISKYPFLNTETFFVHGQYNPRVNVTEKFPNTRNLQLAQISVDGKTLAVANHHGYWLSDKMGDQTSVDCMKIVSDKLRTVTDPIVFAGDLNVVPQSPAMRVFDGFLEDLTATHNLKTTLSQLGKVPDVPCDHILVSPEIKVTNYRVSDALASDHLAVVLEFEL